MDLRPQNSSPGLAARGVLVVAFLPALAAGVALAEVLRRRGLRWTWSLATCAPSALFALPAVLLTRGAIRQAADHGLTTALPVAVLAAWWLVLVGPVAAVWHLHRDRRDRILGGRAAAAVERRRGLRDTWRRRQRGRGAPGDAGVGLRLGLDARRRPVTLPLLRAHCAIVGGSDTGKTNTAAVLLEDHVAAGAGFVVLDGKGGRDLPRLAVGLGARHGRPVALWSLAPYGDAQLDALRLSWSATSDGNPTEIKDRIAASEEQTEPYYAAIAERGLLIACRLLAHTRPEIRLDDLAGLLENDAALAAALDSAADEGLAPDLTWLRGLTAGERSGLRGMGLRLRTMVASDGGHLLLPGDGGRQLHLQRAVRAGWLVVFTLPQGTYPKLIPHVARYALATVNAICTRIEASGRPADTLLFVDELSAFEGDELAATYERARSAGVRVLAATQSLSNFATAGGDKLLHAALDNSELIIVHRQAVPEAAEILAALGGTEETWEHSYKVIDSGMPGGRLTAELGFDEPGERNRRLTDRFRAHPNVIKQLPRGRAVVIAQRPRFAVQVIDVRPSLTTHRRDSPSSAADQPARERP